MIKLLPILLLCVVLVWNTIDAKVYFKEDFSGDWESRWVVSNWRKSDGAAGTWDVTAGKHFSDVEEDKGLHTTTDARFYAISAKFQEDFSNKDKSLVLQYRIKHEQNIDCGGGYVKILPAGLDQANFNGDSLYNIMFGPDICGSATRKVHLIFTYKGKNYLINKNVPCETDELSHIYTLIVKSDNTYVIKIDNKEKATGKLDEDWDMLPAKKIKDPKESKPKDWVDEKEIPDPEDKKPAGWDDTPKDIVDPEAKKPSDWDDDLDGEWEAPTVPNPEYKGEWRAKMIPNPAYKGEWVHPEVDNPDYKYDATLYSFDSNAFVGIEIWQVKAGTIFDDFLVTDSVDEADTSAEKVLKRMEGEKKSKEEDDKKKREEEEKKRKEEEAKKAEEDKTKESSPSEDTLKAEEKKDEKVDL
jgi:calreticulin